MKEPFKKIESDDHTIWITQPKEVETLLERRDTAFNIAKAKLEYNGKLELVVQTGEAFGRGLFADYIKKRDKKWTMDKWIEPLIKKIFNPMGTEATFTKITDKEIKTEISGYRCLDDPGDFDMSPLFIYGFVRGMLLSAFPSGELLVENIDTQNGSKIEFLFKTTDDVDT